VNCNFIYIYIYIVTLFIHYWKRLNIKEFELVETGLRQPYNISTEIKMKINKIKINAYIEKKSLLHPVCYFIMTFVNNFQRLSLESLFYINNPNITCFYSTCIFSSKQTDKIYSSCMEFQKVPLLTHIWTK